MTIELKPELFDGPNIQVRPVKAGDRLVVDREQYRLVRNNKLSDEKQEVIDVEEVKI